MKGRLEAAPFLRAFFPVVPIGCARERGNSSRDAHRRGEIYRSVHLSSSGHSKSWFLRNNRPFFPSLVRVTGVSFGRLTTTDKGVPACRSRRQQLRRCWPRPALSFLRPAWPRANPQTPASTPVRPLGSPTSPAPTAQA